MIQSEYTILLSQYYEDIWDDFVLYFEQLMGPNVWKSIEGDQVWQLTAERNCSELLNNKTHPIPPLGLTFDGVDYTIPAESLLFGFDGPPGFDG